MPDAYPAPTYELTDSALAMISQAQTQVHARHADVAQARAHLSNAEAEFSTALAELNKLLHTLATAPRGVGESKSPG